MRVEKMDVVNEASCADLLGNSIHYQSIVRRNRIARLPVQFISPAILSAADGKGIRARTLGSCAGGLQR